MKKVYSVKPKTEIELQFSDGKALKIVFDARAVYHFSDFGGLESLKDTNNFKEPCALIIYAGSVENNEGITLEIAREIADSLDIDTMLSIINDFTDSLGTVKKEALKEQQKNQMSQFLNSK